MKLKTIEDLSEIKIGRKVSPYFKANHNNPNKYLNQFGNDRYKQTILNPWENQKVRVGILPQKFATFCLFAEQK